VISLGIDPGSHRVGVAFLERGDHVRAKINVVFYGTIEIPPKTPSPENLIKIASELTGLIETYHPDFACVENLFFSKNKKTAQQVYEARGVILHTLGVFSLPILELTANQIKKGVSASGSADKKSIRHSIKMILGMDLTGHDDSWDAIACAFVGLGMDPRKKSHFL
jgi:crossover junction endodeoxyribonuclease RuvC